MSAVEDARAEAERRALNLSAWEGEEYVKGYVYGFERGAKWAASRAVPSDHTATTEDAARVIRTHFWDASDEHLCTCGESPDDYDGDQDDDDQWLAWADWHAAHVAERLAGLLATARPDTTTEWGVRDKGVTLRLGSERDAREHLARSVSATVVRREVTTWTGADQ